MKRLGAWVAAVAAVLAIAGPAAAASTVTYYHNDLAGSPIAATNASAEVVWRESYRPYGERLTKSASAKGNDVWFTSRREDASGLVYMGARYYDPVTGRFVSTDPKGFDEASVQSFNRYAYGYNNPNRYIDPDGRAGVLIAGDIALAVGVIAWASQPEQVRRRQVESARQFIGSIVIWAEGSSEQDAKKPDLTDERGRKHILDGDETGGGHRAGGGKAGKSEFPADWSDEKITGEISDVATDPDATRVKGRGGRTIVQGKKDGVDITVVVDPSGRIITGFPTNGPRNPK